MLSAERPQFPVNRAKRLSWGRSHDQMAYRVVSIGSHRLKNAIRLVTRMSTTVILRSGHEILSSIGLNMLAIFGRSVIVELLLSSVSVALAAAPGEPQSGPTRPAVSPPPSLQTIGTEQVVRNWILCTTQPIAESIARASEEGTTAIVDLYTELAETKVCGQFPELRVILRERLFNAGSIMDDRAQVFSASVKIGDGWPTGFVVYLGAPGR